MDTNQLLTLASSELVFLLTRSAAIQVAFKAPAQRTSDEQTRVRRGLVRSLVLEAAIFVPASAILVILLAPLLNPHRLFGFLDVTNQPGATYALLGVISYGFPFAALKQIVSRMALSTLKEFASIHIKPGELEFQKEGTQKADSE